MNPIDRQFSNRVEPFQIPMHWNEQVTVSQINETDVFEAKKQSDVSILQAMSQVKKVVDHLGGVEGILRVMKNVHQFAQQVQEFAPLISLVWKSMRSDTQNDNHDLEEDVDAIITKPSSNSEKRNRKKRKNPIKRTRSRN